MTAVESTFTTVPPFDVAGLKVFVTGAGRGIGRGIAEVFAAAGADVAMNALTDRFVVDAAKRIAAESGRTVVPVIADLTSSAGVDGAVSEAFDKLGAIDVLVNNLGDSIGRPLAGTRDDPTVMDDAEIELALGINLNAAILCCRAVGAHMIARGHGKVINISSITALRSGADRAVYTAAKAGLFGLTRALALEWGRYGIQVNAISPGIFPDPLSQGTQQLADMAASAANNTVAGRPGDPREVGYLALFFASPASDYVTGQNIAIDGGRSL